MGTYTQAGLLEKQQNGLQNFGVVLVGEGTDPESESSTALGDEVDSKNRGGYVHNGAICTISCFFSNGEGNPTGGQITEVGIEHTTSGVLLWRELLATARTKDNSEGAIVDCQMTSANA